MKTQNIKRLIGAALAALLLAPAHGTPPAPLSVVTVDYARPVKAVHSMVGFLHAADATTPGDDRLLPLHPALWRIGYLWMNNRDRLRKLGIPSILILGDSWGSPEVASMDKWDAFTRTMAERAGGRTYTWDIINEPDLSPSKAMPEQYSELFAHSSGILHHLLGPQTLVSGPSISHYDLKYLTRFLDYCRAHDARVDVLSWHELNSDSDVHAVTDHLLEARRRFLDDPAYKSLGIKKIEINEIVGPSAQYEPGEILGYFDALERGGADGACKGCWDDNCGNNTLDGLLTPDTHTPRAAWWAYKCYADTVPARVASRSLDPRLASFAASGTSAATVLVGCFRDTPSEATLGTGPVAVSLRLAGLARLPFLRTAHRVHVRVQRIPDAGKAPVERLEAVQEQDIAMVGGGVRLLLPPLAAHEADLVTLSKTL